MTTLNQKGFSAVEAVIVVVILAVITGVGFLVWNRKDTTKSQATTKTQAAASVKPVELKAAVDYTEPNSGFKLKAPSGWSRSDGHGIVTQFKAPTVDKDGSASFQANIRIDSQGYSANLDTFASDSVAAAKSTNIVGISNIVVSQENTATTNGVSTSSYEETYTLTPGNANIHCLVVMTVSKGHATDIHACSLASKWDAYKDTFMNGILGFTY